MQNTEIFIFKTKLCVIKIYQFLSSIKTTLTNFKEVCTNYQKIRYKQLSLCKVNFLQKLFLEHSKIKIGTKHFLFALGYFQNAIYNSKGLLQLPLTLFECFKTVIFIFALLMKKKHFFCWLCTLLKKTEMKYLKKICSVMKGCALLL